MKHLRGIRMHLVKEQLEKKCMVIQHTRAEGMVADGASKPLEGEDYINYCRVVQGISHTTGQVYRWALDFMTEQR
jgi:hypothetical protein